MSKFIPLNLEWFSKEDGSLVGEEMACIEATIALKLLDINTEDYTIFSDPQQVNYQVSINIQAYFNNKIDAYKYNYYLYLYGNYECRNGVPVEVPYDPSRYRLEGGSEDENDD